MNREVIIEAIEQAATKGGYMFHSDEEQQMPVAVKSYPALWLVPPQFSSIEGRKHGKVTYAVKLHMMHEGAKFTGQQRNQKWKQMEDEVIEIFASVSQHERVVAVNNLKMGNNSKTHSTHGELVVTATADVVTFF